MRFITILIYIIISLAVGTALIAAAFNLISLSATLNYPKTVELFSSPFDYYTNLLILGAGILLFLLSLRYLSNTLIYSRKNKGINLEMPNGKVTITFAAIEDLLKKILEAKKELSHVRPKVFIAKKGKEIGVIIRSNLTTQASLKNLSYQIQQDIQERIQTLIGDERPVTVNIEIRKMEANSKLATTIEEPEPVVPFRIY